MPHVRREQVIGYRVGAQGLLRDGSSLGTLALAWTLRGAPHVHRRTDLDWLAAALWPLSDADALGRVDAGSTMKKAGMAGLAGFAAGAEAMRKVVTAPMGKGAASTAVTAATPDTLHRYCRSCQATHVFELIFRMGSLPAGIELEPGTAPPVLVPRPGAAVPTSADPAAVQRLIRAYLTLLGPATQGDGTPAGSPARGVRPVPASSRSPADRARQGSAQGLVADSRASGRAVRRRRGGRHVASQERQGSAGDHRRPVRAAAPGRAPRSRAGGRARRGRA